MESTSQKSPIGIAELLTRAATYGALIVCSGGFLWLILFLHGVQTKSVDTLRSDVATVRSEIATVRDLATKTNNDFIEFRAETRANFKAIEVRFTTLEKAIDMRFTTFEEKLNARFDRIETLLEGRQKK